MASLRVPAWFAGLSAAVLLAVLVAFWWNQPANPIPFLACLALVLGSAGLWLIQQQRPPPPRQQPAQVLHPQIRREQPGLDPDEELAHIFQFATVQHAPRSLTIFPRLLG